jgi:hypothetical protein
MLKEPLNAQAVTGCLLLSLLCCCTWKLEHVLLVLTDISSQI